MIAISSASPALLLPVELFIYISKNEIYPLESTSVHVDRIAGGYRDYRHSRRALIARSQQGKKQGTADYLRK
jgi:hypothetical protein